MLRSEQAELAQSGHALARTACLSSGEAALSSSPDPPGGNPGNTNWPDSQSAVPACATSLGGAAPLSVVFAVNMTSGGVSAGPLCGWLEVPAGCALSAAWPPTSLLVSNMPEVLLSVAKCGVSAKSCVLQTVRRLPVDLCCHWWCLTRRLTQCGQRRLLLLRRTQTDPCA